MDSGNKCESSTPHKDDHDSKQFNLTNTTEVTSKGTSEPVEESKPLPYEEADNTKVSNEGNMEQQTVPGSLSSDDSDTRWLGWGRPVQEQRPKALMSVEKHSPNYKMDHKSRGQAIILVHDHFCDQNLIKRDCATHDANLTKAAFKCLGFEIEEHWNLDRKGFLELLKKVSERDHQQSDCLVVVFMSHGDVHKNNIEFLWTYDQEVNTSELWKNFTPDKCPSLAGKPKLFFIQACRGTNSDKGVKLKRPKAMRVETDSFFKRDTEEYVIPLYADMLMMWASYPGTFAFKSKNNGIKGSVFLHFLAEVLIDDSKGNDLSSMLLRVTREVATEYESYCPGDYRLDNNKQIPQIHSTLMRKIYFFEKTT